MVLDLVEYNSMKKVAVDVDGVICNTPAMIDKEFQERGIKVKLDGYHPVIEGLRDSGELMGEIASHIFTYHNDELEPYDGIREELRNINRFVGDVTFVTARRPQFNYQTVSWLNRYVDIPYTLINRTSVEKVPYLLENGFHYFIEDRLQTANEAAKAGIVTFLINRKWNMGRETHPDVIRISLFGTFFSLITSKGL